MKSCAGALDLFQDVVGLGSPDKKLWFFVVMINVFSNNDDQFFDTVEDAAAQPISVRSRKKRSTLGCLCVAWLSTIR